jgi:hypothetical protein
LNLSPEWRLLLASALFPLQEVEPLRTCCSQRIDWEGFDALVERHRILPTVYRNLSTHAPELVPPSALARLKQRTELNRQRILQILAELSRLSQLFEQKGIQLCALKGPLLSQHLFGDVSLRTSRDLDLLIRPEAVAQSEALLLAHGYQRRYPAVPLTPRQWQMYQQEWHDLSYYLPKNHVLVELHWAVASPNLVSFQEAGNMLSRARPTALAGASIDTLSKEDLPAYLLIHGSRHSWARLKWLVDFVVWIRRTTDPDWEGLKMKMEDLGLQRSLVQGVLLAHWLYSTPIPEPVQALLVAEPPAQDMADHSYKTIMNAQYSGTVEGAQRLRLILYRTKLKKDLRYKWNAFNAIWAVPEDWLDLPLPDALYPLYWLLRPFLWLRRYHLSRRRGRPRDVST